MHARRLAPLAVFAALASSHALGDTILTPYSGSITTYLYSSGTGLQNVRPLVNQRGVHFDGGVRAPDVHGWAKAGNPFGDVEPGRMRIGDVDLANGTYSPTEIDLALPAHVPWVVGRSYNHAQVVSGHHDSNGPMGYNWFYLGQPELAFYNGATDDLDVIYLVYGADRYLEFKRTGVNDGTFRAVNGAAGVIEYETTQNEPDRYVYYDQAGNRTYFFGDNTASDKADWQLWRVVDPAGNIAYVGDSDDPSDAVDNGYNSDKTISKAYDSFGRRYCHSYSSVGVSRLTQVKVETDEGDGWQGCGEDELVATVDYTYYTTNESTRGKIGDLKMVKVTTFLSDGSTTLERKRYYRYYDDTWNDTDERRGEPHMIRMVLGEEGTRGYDWTDATFDEDFLTASDTSLKAYAEAYLEYVSASDYRVSTVFSNGECGCSGGVDGEHAIAYSANGSFSGSSGYDTDWFNRVVVTQPDAIYFTQYFDETGQTLSRVVTDAAPTGVSDMWATEVLRDSDGQVIEVRSPAANVSYTHSTGALVGDDDGGLVTVYVRVGGGDTDGFLAFVKHQQGYDGTEYYDAKVEYTDRDLNIAGSVNVTRPMISARRAYHAVNVGSAGVDTASNYHATSLSYTWWSSTNTDVLYITLKKATTTHPTVTTAQNGSNAATTSERHIRKEGTTAFSVAQDGITTYTRFNTAGLLDKIIEDCQTNHASDFASGDDPNTDFGITETSSGLRRITEHSYDAQGRPDTTTLPDGRITMRAYSKLGDERPVVFSVPRVVNTETATYHGPAGYSVSNHAGNIEDCFIIAVITAGSIVPPASWVAVVQDEPVVDPLDAIDPEDIGPIARWNKSVYDESGTHVEESRVYYDIVEEDYDATLYAYDDMGRQRRVLEPTGTITRMVYDDLGRSIEQWIGTNDNSNGNLTGGTSNMVKVQSMVYDSGADGGNGYLTMSTAYVEADNDNKRDTSFLHDLRGRAIVALGPQAPYAVSKFDNLGRLIATGLYSSTSGLDATDDPTGLTTNRVALSQTFYDERGMVYKTQRHEIDQSDGSDDDNLQDLTWYDSAGRVIKVDGEQLVKTTYDRLGRTTKTFILASMNDTAYADADDVTGDIVLEEMQTTYESSNSDNVVMAATISREHDDLSDGTTGALDSNADADELKYTAANLAGRIQITASWFDAIDRVQDTVVYGTYNGADFDRDGLSVPSRSDTALRTTYTYNDDGTVLEVADPKDLKTRWTYDEAGRKVTEIRNYVNGTPSSETGDDDNYVRFVYTDGLMTKMWVDLDGDGNGPAEADTTDQQTLYIYGSNAGTPASMILSTGHLLRAVVYPDSTNTGDTVSEIDSDSSDVASYAYNAQGEQVYVKDQAGNVIETNYDTGGRETQRRVSTLAGSFNGAVRRVATTYLSRGLVSKVTQYDDPDVGEGNIVDDVKHAYDNWGNLTTFTQDVDSDIDGSPSGRASFAVTHGYSKATTGRNTLRRTLTTLPASRSVAYSYSSAGNLLDDAASRVTDLSLDTGGGETTMATYQYLGGGMLVGTTLEDPDVFYRLYSSGYDRLDRFDRVIASIWTKDLSTDKDFCSVSIDYDRNSNITGITDNILKNSGGNRNFDAMYTIDNLNRLTQTEEGTLSGSISNRSRNEIWTLTQTGNWKDQNLDLNGDNDYSDTGEFQDDRTHDVVNQLTKRELDTNATAGYEETFNLAFDANGNQTDDGEDYTYVYDAFNRLKEVKRRSNGALRAEYRYNGLGFRIGWHYDTDADNDVDANDPWYYFAYDDSWRIVAVFRASDSSPKEVFIHHNAGLGGHGSSSYIDSVILRDRDHNSGWTSAADGVLEQRRYYCQNFRADVSAILTDTGKMVEWVKYSSYGVPFALPAGDTDSDGDWDATDATDIGSNYTPGSSYSLRRDADLDGDVDASDVTHANSITGGYQTLGRPKLTSTAVANRIGYAGYQLDPTFGNARQLYHVRHRVLDAEVGRWTRRDPLGYVDGMRLYEYVRSTPINGFDSRGLWASCTSRTCAQFIPPPPPPPPYVEPAPAIPVPPYEWQPAPSAPETPARPIPTVPLAPTAPAAPAPSVFRQCWTTVSRGTGTVIRCCVSRGTVVCTMLAGTRCDAPIQWNHPPPSQPSIPDNWQPSPLDPLFPEDAQPTDFERLLPHSECARLQAAKLSACALAKSVGTCTEMPGMPCEYYRLKQDAWHACMEARRAYDLMCFSRGPANDNHWQQSEQIIATTARCSELYFACLSRMRPSHEIPAGCR